MKRRNLILLLGGASSGAMSVGTGAFSSMEAERGVEVNVVGNKDAFIGYYVPRGVPEDKQYIPEDASNNGDPVENGERIPLVEVRSRLSKEQEISLVGVQIEQGYDVLKNESYEVKRKLPNSDGFEDVEHVDITEGSTEPDPVDAPENGFGPGGYERITAKVNGIDPGEEADLVITVSLRGVEGTGIAAQLFGDTRVFTIEGREDDTAVEPDVPEFAGNGNVFLDPKGVVVEVLALYGEATGERGDTRVEPDTEVPVTWDTSEHNQFKNARQDGQDDFDPSDELLAVYFVHRGLVYYNPKYDQEDIGFPDDWPEPESGETKGNN